MKILLAVDGSEYTKKMLDYVCANKTLFDASHQYTVFNAQPVLPPHARSALGASVVHEYHDEEAKKVLQPARAALEAQGLKADEAYQVGHVGDTIADYAQKNRYDMIIMGSHGHKSLAQLVMGSVSTEVLAQCGVPVLLIR